MALLLRIPHIPPLNVGQKTSDFRGFPQPLQTKYAEVS
jgi:hypothetical protein